MNERGRKTLQILARGAILLATAVAGSSVWAGDWPGWRGPMRDGRSSDTGLLKTWPEGGPALLWKAEGIGKGYSSAAVVGDTVYTSGDVGENLMIFAIDAAGRQKWSLVQGPAFTKSYGGSRSTPVSVSGRETASDGASSTVGGEAGSAGSCDPASGASARGSAGVASAGASAAGSTGTGSMSVTSAVLSVVSTAAVTSGSSFFLGIG